MGENLNRLIARAKPKAVLLTTYTFGLSYFEAAILPTLNRHECGSVAVLVDEGQFQASLADSHSGYAGRGYRIISVRAPGGGIFHPKLAYLVSDDADTLVVASGNLTFLGQGGNLECLDAVRSSSCPEVFEEVAWFFRTLAQAMPDAASQGARVLIEFSERASEQWRAHQADAANRARHTWLLHTLSTPVAEQLETLVPSLGTQMSKLTVMSPYHAPDGAPILGLANALGIKKIALALDPKHHSIALEPKRFKRTKDMSFVLPSLDDESRESHAKWFEIAMDNAVFVMTGSVNATSQSFASTKNVEVSLARVIPKGVVEWQEATLRELKYSPFPHYNTMNAPGLVDAVLQADGQLHGLIYGTSFETGAISVDVLRDGECVCTATDVKLMETGRFSCTVETRLTEADGALQVRARGEGFEALGWLSNELQLEATEVERQKLAAVNRVLSETYTAEDVNELFSLLTSITNAVPPSTVRRAPAPSGVASPLTPTPFSLQTWQQSGQQHFRPGLLGRLSGRAFDAFYRWLNSSSQRLGGTSAGVEVTFPGPAGPESPAEVPKSTLLSDASGETPDAAEEETTTERDSRLVHRLVQAIPEKLKEHPSHPNAAELARLAGAVVVRDALRIKPGGGGAAHSVELCLNWLDSYSRIGLGTEAVAALEPFIVAMGCLAVGVADRVGTPDNVAAQVKEDFERFGVDMADEPRLRRACELAAGHRAFSFVEEGMRTQLGKELPRVLVVETARDTAVRLLTRLEGGGLNAPTQTESQIFGQDFVEALKGHEKDRKKPYGIVKHLERAHCPCCYFSLPADVVRRLRRTHAAVCPQITCKRALMWIPELSSAQGGARDGKAGT